MIHLLVTVLCLLLWSLVEVHSQTVTYASFLGETLPNHAYVDINRVRNPLNTLNNNGIECHTDLPTCCRSEDGTHRGNWYYPNGTRLRFRGDDDTIFQSRQNQQVDLRRKTYGIARSGIYSCNIPTIASSGNGSTMTESIYVGLYDTGGGDIKNVTLTMDVNDRGASSHFTLTCISTGGPATTVTWTRDTIPITEGTETVLNDAVTAQYTHTLTGRLGGHYTCTVANDKPSSDSAQLQVELGSMEVHPQSVIFHPVNANVVRISWSNNPYLSTLLYYTSFFTATGAMISHSETVLSAVVDSTDVTIDIDRDGYDHNFTLQYIATSDFMIPPAPITTATFAFDKKYFQIQFGPIDYCLSWGLEKTGRIEDKLQSRLTLIIRERCNDCYTFSTDYLRQGQFLCHGNPTTATYRSTLVNPFPTTNSTELVGIIQSWVLTCPSLILNGLVVRVSHDVPTCRASLDDGECVSAVETDSGVSERISQVLSVCAVRELGQEICTI